MKKSIIALAMAGAMAATAANADTTVFGSVEQRIEMRNSVTDMVSDDTYVGVKATEALGESASAFAVISLDVDGEGTNASATRDAYVGLEGSVGGIQLGRMPNLRDELDDATVDAFEGRTFGVTDAGRVSNAARVSMNFDAVGVAAQVYTDGANGEEKVDAYEVAANVAVGPVGVVGLYADDQNTDTTTMIGGASLTVAETISVAGTYERVDVAGVETDTYTVVGGLDLGNNTLKGGYQKADSVDGVYIAEAVHNFSKNTRGYVNYLSDDGTDESVVSAGLRVNF